MNNWLRKESENLADRFAAVRNRAAFAREYQVPGGQAMIYQHINGIRPISLEAAKAYARGFGCRLEDISPRLAQEVHEASALIRASAGPPVVPIVPVPESSAGADAVTINQYDASDMAGTSGRGLVLRDQPGVIRSWRVSREWLNGNVRHHSGQDKLCIVTGFGDSMRPLFNPGDPLLVDTGVRTVDFDSVYFFRIRGEGYIKRLQRIPTEEGLVLRAISENRAAYEPFDIKGRMSFEVLGRVLKVWRGQEF